MSDDKRKFKISGITIKVGTGTSAKPVKINDFETDGDDLGSDGKKKITLTDHPVTGEDGNSYHLDIEFTGEKG